jgi:glycosyltransferase involved in cell wall biosynthesis
MDGLEWKRSKYNAITRRFLRWAEKLAAHESDILVADSPGIQQHITSTLHLPSHYIPYGSDVVKAFDPSVIEFYGLKQSEYYMVLARLEPENNIEMIVNGFLNAQTDKKLLIVGNTNTPLARKLKRKYTNHSEIVFTGAIYETNILNALRHYSAHYFHGHSVGGTNPSLLEAMACGCTIVANNNIFNQYVLGDGGIYFSSEQDITGIINSTVSEVKKVEMLAMNLEKIRLQYNWKSICDSYENLILA